MSNQVVLDLTKKLELNLAKAGFTKLPIMEVKMAIDKSGSMSEEFAAGFVENAIELFMGAAAKFDDNGQLEYTFFNWDADDTKTVGVNEYKKIRIPSAGGGTNYKPALVELLNTAAIGSSSAPVKTGFFKSLFGSKPDDSATPSPAPATDLKYVAFLTDGDAGDTSETLDYINRLDDNVFVQFIAIGTQLNLNTLAQLGGRANTSHFVIENPKRLSADELYEKIANQKLLAWVNSK